LLTVVQDTRGVRGARIKQWQRAIADPFQLQSGAGENGTRLACPGPALDREAGLLSLDPQHITFAELVL